jgi:hypothetical protein
MAEFIRVAQNVDGDAGGLTKANVRDAINAIDDWVDTNASAFNTAIPTPARTEMTVKQKTFALAYVIFKRAGIL